MWSGDCGDWRCEGTEDVALTRSHYHYSSTEICVRSLGNMPPTCQAFVENAWKKDLCANCFKSLEEHRAELARKSLVGVDSLSELEQGTNRYLTVTGPSFAGNSRYRKQIREVVRKNSGNCHQQ